MNAQDVMTSSVVSVASDTPTSDVAKVLIRHGISAVPVVDATGAPLGMISEGDLIGRDETDREARRDWWLTLLAEGEELPPAFLATLHQRGRVAGDVMVSPVIAISEDTELGAIAKLLVEHRVKRVPVIKEGRIVGIVSRADLVRAFAAQERSEGAPANGSLFANTLLGIDDRFGRLLRHHTPTSPAAVHRPDEPNDTRLTVADFRGLVAGHAQHKIELEREHQTELADQRRQRVVEMIDQHISEASWRALVHQARQAAEQGEKEFMLVRFPSGLCGDGGRAINSTRPEWPESLRGESAEIYLRWEQDLKPHGFTLSAKVLDFPGGMPGDIGLTLMWGE